MNTKQYARIEGHVFNPQVEKFLLAALVVSQAFSSIPYLRIILVVVLFAYAFFRMSQIQRAERVSVWSNPFLMLTVILAFFSVFWSLDPEATFYAVAASFAVLFLVTHFKSVLSAQQVLDGVALGLKFLIVSSIILESMHVRGIVLFEKVGEDFQGVTSNPNQLGFLTVVSIVVFLVQKKERPVSGWAKAIIWISGSLYLLVNTGAEAAPFYLLAAVLIFGASVIVRRRKYLAFPGILIIVTLTIWASQESVRSGFATILGIDSNTTISGRTLLWSASVDAILSRPILGYGLSSLRDIRDAPNSEMYALWSRFDFGTFSSHNGYIEILLHLGVVGFLLFMAALALAGWQSLKYRDFSYFALLVVLVLYNFSEVRFFTPPLAWLLVCVVAVGALKRHPVREVSAQYSTEDEKS